MPRYANCGGDSGVRSYRATSRSIIVTFTNGSKYLYDDVVPGARFVAQMTSLAAAGRGLNEFINVYVRKNYRAKLQ
jgi:hypothetical protein